jgi:ABC-type cobalamin/Fe3+-siderophores transport system ATPase subunit
MGLSTHGLTVGHGGRALLGPLDLELPAGRFVCLIGANGAGKSTLIRTLCGMQSAVSGEVRIGGVALGRISQVERARRLAVVLTERVEVAQLTAIPTSAGAAGWAPPTTRRWKPHCNRPARWRWPTGWSPRCRTANARRC